MRFRISVDHTGKIFLISFPQLCMMWVHDVDAGAGSVRTRAPYLEPCCRVGVGAACGALEL